DGRAARVPGHQDHVVAVGALHGDAVGRAVAHARAGNAGQVEVDLGQVGAAQVVDGDLVRAALGGEVDALDAVEVHRAAGHVAVDPPPVAVGGEVDPLGDGGAVDLQRVGAALPLDDVAAVAGVPHERVVPGPHQRRVVAGAAVDQVGALAADQQVGAGA